MVENIGPGTAVAQMTENEYRELLESLQEDVTDEGHRGGPLARVGAFLGLWRTMDGTNLRVGQRRDDTFVPAGEHGAELVQRGDKVNLVLRQLYLPHLPYNRCVAQVTWEASHWFDDRKNAQVTHVTSCDASQAGSAAAVGLPIFQGLKVEEGIGLKIAIYVMADRDSQPILDLLGSPTVGRGLALAGRFNPVFAMTGPYIQAAITGLVKMSRKNFKLANWPVGFGLADAPVPLAYGEYIFLDGVMRIGSQRRTLAWPDLKWDRDQECPTYRDGPFHAPYVMVRVLKHSGTNNTERATTGAQQSPPAGTNRRTRARATS